jgi:hypothetical protein
MSAGVLPWLGRPFFLEGQPALGNKIAVGLSELRWICFFKVYGKYFEGLRPIISCGRGQ